MITLSSFIEKNAKKLLFISTIFYVVSVSSVSFLKYHFHLYNSLDLAIFSHVLWNSVQGDFLFSNINPSSYFGDHVTFILPLIIPIYALVTHPLTLLVIQTVALSSAAIPLYIIANTKLSNAWSLLIALMWLGNPFIHYINLFEFHIISFFPVCVLTVWLWYVKNKLWWYIPLLIITLGIREDTALALIGVGMLQLFLMKKSKKSIVFGTITITLSILWLLIAKIINDVHTLEGTYKFLKYYEWLGNDFNEIVLTIIKNPFLILKKIMALDALLFIIILFLPQLFIPLTKPKYLLGMLFPVMLLVLTAHGISGLAVFLHYSVYFHPFLFLSLIYALHYMLYEKYAWKTVKRYKDLLIVVLVTGTVSLSIMLSPVLYVTLKTLGDFENLNHDKLNKEYLLKAIPDNRETIASGEFLTDLAHTKKLHYMGYLYDNQYQLSNTSYNFPKSPQTLIYAIHEPMLFDMLEETSKFFPSDPVTFSKFVEEKFSVAAIRGKYILLKQKSDGSIAWYREHSSIPQNITRLTKENDTIQMIGWDTTEYGDSTIIHLYMRLTEKLEKPIQWQIEGKTIDDNNYRTISPPSLGLKPSTTWPRDKIIETIFVVPKNINYSKKIIFTPIHISGKKVLGRDASSHVRIETITALDSPTELVIQDQ